MNEKRQFKNSMAKSEHKIRNLRIKHQRLSMKLDLFKEIEKSQRRKRRRKIIKDSEPKKFKLWECRKCDGLYWKVEEAIICPLCNYYNYKLEMAY